MTQFKMKLPAGWYPSEPEACRLEIQSFLNGFKNTSTASSGGIVPHAGWDYSGKLAARVFSALSSACPNPDALCIIGGHLASYHPVLFVDAHEAQTPLGSIPLHRELTRKVVQNLSETMEDPNEGDNTLEIQLPMIKYFFPQTPLMAFRAPVSSLAEELGLSLAQVALKENLKILVVASADLTHYGPNYNFMPQGVGEEALNWVKTTNDREIIELSLQGKSNEVWNHGKTHSSSCSSGAMAAAVAFGRETLFQPHLIEYYTSHEVYASNSFVGYAGIVF